MKAFLTLFLFLSLASLGFTQGDPTIEPSFFSADDEITITYDVSGTSLSNLNDAWIWMWVPGESIDAPSNINPANSNSAATNPAKFTKSTGSGGQTLFSITLTPSQFLGTSADNIKSIGMLLKGNDWSDGQTSDYITEVSEGFAMALDAPASNYGFYNSVTTIPVEVRTSESATIAFYVDDVLVTSVENSTTLSTTHQIIDDGNVHILKVSATKGEEQLEKFYSYTLTPTPQSETLPDGMVDGINYSSTNSTATLALRAPNKEHVFVIGDFNNWSLSNEFLMKKDGEVFWLTIENLDPSREYLFQYLVDGELKIADPYAEKISSPFDDNEIISENRYPNLVNFPNGLTTEAASFLKIDSDDFSWSEFTRPAKEDLIIYELLIRDFTEERTYNAVTDRLDYLADLGVNAIELMPIQEFEGNLSWGYNPAFMFAVDKYYGTELDLKTLIDECHKRGIAVILDIVLNHQFGRNTLARLYNEGTYGNPTSENPWFNTSPKHDFNVGYDMNHESQYTKDYTDRVVKYWLEEYNVDGYRFDLSKGFTQKNSLGNVGLWGNYDATRIAIWKRIADVIWDQDPSAYIILEHFADNSEEKELAAYGMMLWGNMNHTYRNAAKGNSVSLGQTYHGNRGWDQPNLVSYMESHDEERQMWDLQKSRGKVEALERAKLASAFFFTVPGPKMIWQFGEFGYDEELNNDRLGIKPTRWEYLDDPKRKQLFDVYKSLINLRTKTDYISEDYFSWSSAGRVKTINILHPEVEFYIVGNFGSDPETTEHKFSKSGTWYNYFTGETIDVTEPNQEITLQPGAWYIFTSEQIDNYIENQQVLTVDDTSQDLTYFYPNPTKDLLKVTSSQYSFYEIYDMSGRQLLQGELDSSREVNLNELDRGVYQVILSNKTERISRQVIKE